MPLLGRWVAIGVALDDDDVSVVQQTIERSAGQKGVSKDGRELIESAVRSNDGRGALIAQSDDIVEVDGLVRGKGAQPEVIDYQQIGACEAQEASLVATVSTSGTELFEHVTRSGIQDLVTDQTGALTQRLGDVTLADT
jgi:hypothetical protein